jgi:hypothetical protein
MHTTKTTRRMRMLKLRQDTAEATDERLGAMPCSALCETCKHFGGQGCYGLNKEEKGDTRYCACCSFGDFDKDTAPMPEWRVTWGNAGGSKGNIYVHKTFGCVNHNPEFDPQNDQGDGQRPTP